MEELGEWARGVDGREACGFVQRKREREEREEERSLPPPPPV